VKILIFKAQLAKGKIKTIFVNKHFAIMIFLLKSFAKIKELFVTLHSQRGKSSKICKNCPKNLYW